MYDSIKVLNDLGFTVNLFQDRDRPSLWSASAYNAGGRSPINRFFAMGNGASIEEAVANVLFDATTPLPTRVGPIRRSPRTTLEDLS